MAAAIGIPARASPAPRTIDFVSSGRDQPSVPHGWSNLPIIGPIRLSIGNSLVNSHFGVSSGVHEHTTKEEAFTSDHGGRRDKAANWGKGKADTALDLLP